jgi:hypothetical protein
MKKDELIEQLLSENRISYLEASILKEEGITFKNNQKNDFVFPEYKLNNPVYNDPKIKFANDELERRANVIKNCSCNPSNGGSGMCGCSLTTLIIT